MAATQPSTGEARSPISRKERAVAGLESFRDRLAEKHGLDPVVAKTDEWADDVGRTVKHGQMGGRFVMMIQAAVTLAVGVLVVGSIFNALPAADGPMANASDQVERLTGTAFELAPIVLIVIVASLVLRIVRGL